MLPTTSGLLVINPVISLIIFFQPDMNVVNLSLVEQSFALVTIISLTFFF